MVQSHQYLLQGRGRHWATLHHIRHARPPRTCLRGAFAAIDIRVPLSASVVLFPLHDGICMSIASSHKRELN